MASSSDKENSKNIEETDIDKKDDIVDAEIVDETEEVIASVDEMADADGVAKDEAENEDAQEPGEDETEEASASDDSETQDAETEAVAAEPVAQAQPAEQKSVFLPMLLGGVAAAGIGYLLADYLGKQGPSVEDLAALQASIDDQKVTIDAQTGEIDALEAALEASSASLEAVSAENVEQSELIAQLNAKIDEKLTPSGNAVLPEDLSALLQAQKDEISSLQNDLKDMAAFAEGQIQSAKDEAEAAERAEARAKARDALNAVRLALASGDPFGDQLEAIAGAVDVPEGLSAVKDGVPTQAALQNGFGEFARQALAASNRELAGDSASERVGLFFQDIIGTRSLTPQEGDSPDAVLSRVEAAVTNGDLSGALETISALPEGGKAALSGWVEQAQARDGALSAFSELTNALSAD